LVVLGPGSSFTLEVAGSIDSGSNVSKLERSQPLQTNENSVSMQ
jgi:hypothetical protein